MKTYIDNLFVAVVAFSVALMFASAVANDLRHLKSAPAADIVACAKLPHAGQA